MTLKSTTMGAVWTRRYGPPAEGEGMAELVDQDRQRDGDEAEDEEGEPRLHDSGIAEHDRERDRHDGADQDLPDVPAGTGKTGHSWAIGRPGHAHPAPARARQRIADPPRP